MTVRGRVFLGLGAVAAVLVVPSLFAASRLAQLRTLAVEGRSGQAAAVGSLGRIRAGMAELDRLARSYVAISDPQLGYATITTADSLRADYERLRASRYGDHTVELGPAVERLAMLAARIDQDVRAGRTTAATEALGTLMAAFAEADREVAEVADAIDAVASLDFERAQLVSESGRRQTLLGLALALLAAAGVSVVTAGSLTGPLRRLCRAMARVADGAFEGPHELPFDRSDEIGELMRSFETMAQRLADLDRMKAEFLGMASHELKTPLNVINGYAELIEEARAGEVSERHRALIAGLAEQATVMSRLVNRMMDLSRLEAGAYELAPEPVLIKDLLSGIEQIFALRAKEGGVDLRIRTSATAPSIAVMDFDIVRDEVLGNLLANALRYTPPGGWIELRVDGDDFGVVFTVTDSGPGIPDGHREFIFKKHYTVDRTRGVGSGLGLAIVKEMVELHGGLIALDESPADVGARFRVALPLEPVSALPEPPRADPLPTFAPLWRRVAHRESRTPVTH
jgi:signal transduction histidine kinase